MGKPVAHVRCGCRQVGHGVSERIRENVGHPSPSRSRCPSRQCPNPTRIALRAAENPRVGGSILPRPPVCSRTNRPWHGFHRPFTASGTGQKSARHPSRSCCAKARCNPRSGIPISRPPARCGFRRKAAPCQPACNRRSTRCPTSPPTMQEVRGPCPCASHRRRAAAHCDHRNTSSRPFLLRLRWDTGSSGRRPAALP